MTSQQESNSLSRRKFLVLTSAGVVAVGGGTGFLLRSKKRDDPATKPAGTSEKSASQLPDARPNSDRVLIYVQLSGGNDGLATLIPEDLNVDRSSVEPLPEEVLTFDGLDGYRVISGLGPVAPWFESGQFAFLPGIGLPLTDRSHFSSLDSWWSAMPGSTRTSGWIGRYLDALGDTDPLSALALGSSLPALNGLVSSSTTVLDPADFGVVAPRGVSQSDYDRALAVASEVSGDDLFARAANSIGRAQSAARDFEPYASELGGYDEELVGGEQGRVGEAESFCSLAASIAVQSEVTRVVGVVVGGYDTHDDQQGTQRGILGDLGRGLASIEKTVSEAGAQDRVVTMVVSEFGRRIIPNAGGGCDHGWGGLAMLAGGPVNGGVHGEFDFRNPVNGDLPVVLDGRALYASVLDWLGADTESILDGFAQRTEALEVV